MEWLKQGITIVLKETHLGYKKIANFEEYSKSNDLYLCYNSDGIHSGYLYNDIDWEETVKLNGIDLDKQKYIESLIEIGDSEEQIKNKVNEVFGEEKKFNPKYDRFKELQNKKFKFGLEEIEYIEYLELCKELMIPKNPEKELGRKENKGKIRPNLLPITELKEVIRVFEFGVDKYSINNWKHVKDPINEYSNALSRHLLDYLEGEKKASDSNLPHLAHICANALILMWFENNKED